MIDYPHDTFDLGLSIYHVSDTEQFFQYRNFVWIQIDEGFQIIGQAFLQASQFVQVSRIVLGLQFLNAGDVSLGIFHLYFGVRESRKAFGKRAPHGGYRA